MDAIEKRALAQLAQLLQAGGCEGELRIGRKFGQALIAEIAALTPPEGYVMVPSVLPEKMLDALYCAEGDMSDDDMQKLWQQLLAARPEVP
ncbi:hypothetical protein [Stenotrophomonas maltophilia]|uniref:hypothetical protein n=1 Tax=Stenotrophomonas maltophilia TaxID=40324 RepID=UPI002B1DC32A|nr:hypothetical protein [Stenotrophomonas maltophilia]